MRFVSLALLMLGIAVVNVVNAAETHTVQLEDKQFIYQDRAMEKIFIKRGDKVLFKNNDSVDYEIGSHSKAKPFRLGVLKPGSAKAVKFDKAGSVEVECAIHAEMFLEIQVQ